MSSLRRHGVLWGVPGTPLDVQVPEQPQKGPTGLQELGELQISSPGECPFRESAEWLSAGASALGKPTHLERSSRIRKREHHCKGAGCPQSLKQRFKARLRGDASRWPYKSEKNKRRALRRACFHGLGRMGFLMQGKRLSAKAAGKAEIVLRHGELTSAHSADAVVRERQCQVDPRRQRVCHTRLQQVNCSAGSGSSALGNNREHNSSTRLNTATAAGPPHRQTEPLAAASAPVAAPPPH